MATRLRGHGPALSWSYQCTLPDLTADQLNTIVVWSCIRLAECATLQLRRDIVVTLSLSTGRTFDLRPRITKIEGGYSVRCAVGSLCTEDLAEAESICQRLVVAVTHFATALEWFGDR